ncbi:phosphatidate cytidylyltransferase [Caloramator sp.]|jgi:phosphatidate cytidylyltransferase|uniref:phosphatidate cytidylyltransferase n=1 Tax=Caloramator sp. TaxID=1871330 RepID=UPI0025C52032|nr:phosphatidate cytidylyltransferase [Caloramator sp.]
MKTRIISALVAIPILLFFVISGGLILKIGVSVVTAIAVYEYINAFEKKYRIITPLLIIFYLINQFIFYTSDLSKYNTILIYTLLLISMAYPIFNKKYSIISSAFTVVGYIYIISFFNLLVKINEMKNGNKLIWMVFLIAWCCDTFAYFTGMFFGKRKLCPEVSPKKTVEGSIGGILGSIVGLVIWKIFNGNIEITYIQLIILGIIGAVVSQIGDLSASLIKRHVGIKDYGNIMPGHGGILDRFDSILFIIPVVYYYIAIILG